ncbi:MAG: hypothetical protein H8E61_11235 [Bacteroidetes bacterium]|nr:hypothetical protein [Bacteroidota bacterium]
MEEKINRKNYEVWLIDYIDNKLTDAQRVEVESFLASNPDLKQELENLETVPVDSLIVFENKDQLKKELKDLIPEDFTSLDDFMLANLEGDLNFEQQKKFNVLINSDNKTEEEYSYYLQSKLQPDVSVVFPDKIKLKKGLIYSLPVLNKSYSLVVSIAAILLVLVIMVNINLVQNNLLNSKSFASIHYSDKEAKPQRLKWAFNSELNIETRSISHQNDLNMVHLASINTSAKTVHTADGESSQKNEIQQNSHDQIQIAAQDIHEMKGEKAAIMTNKLRIEKTSSPALDIPANNSIPIAKYVSNQFRIRALNEEDSIATNRKLSVWDLADAGLRRIGNLFNRDVRLDKEYNENGEVIALAFNSPRLGFSAPLKRNRP